MSFQLKFFCQNQEGQSTTGHVANLCVIALHVCGFILLFVYLSIQYVF